jgi:hypothetical protein
MIVHIGTAYAALAQASLYHGQNGRRRVAGIYVYRPPGRDAVGMRRGSGDGPNLVRNGSTVHHGDAMTGRKKFWPECCSS